MKDLIFYIIIFLSNIIQGITGFAGTILAMSPSMLLVGYDVCKPILNVLGILAGLCIMLKGIKHVAWKELARIIPCMMIGIVVGILLKPFLSANERILYFLFGIFVLFLAVKGFWEQKKHDTGVSDVQKKNWIDWVILVAAGVIHGLFVSGGPLLIEYVNRRKMNQQSFRTTVSAVWVVLNTMILVDDIRFGYWNGALILKLCITLPFFFGGIYLGGWLSKKMSRAFFVRLTYGLMAISGIVLLLK